LDSGKGHRAERVEPNYIRLRTKGAKSGGQSVRRVARRAKHKGHRAKNVEPNCIRLVRDLVTFELGITCQRLPDLAVFGGDGVV